MTTPTPESTERARKFIWSVPHVGACGCSECTTKIEASVNSLALEFDRIAIEAKIEALEDAIKVADPDHSGRLASNPQRMIAMVIKICLERKRDELRAQLAAHDAEGGENNVA